MNLFSLSGKTALVAGASQGIGPKIAQQLAGAGAHAGMVEGAQDNPRLGAQDDIAPLAVFLAGKGADYITGQIIAVDGGYSTTAVWPFEPEG
jgi:NAD(P)-dependent dehydrogenase (short-subunit alcohol dehydrogenase family)